MNRNMDGNSPLVSIIMPTYNRARFLEQSIRCALNQTYGSWELIVIDDGSTDESVDIVRRLSGEDGRITLLELGQNSGNPSVARNAGAPRASGKYVAFLDSDDLWHTEKLSKQVAVMESAGDDVALCHHDMAVDVEDGGYLDGTTFSHSRMRRKVEGRCFEELLMRDFIPNSSVMVRRDALLERQPWFDPALPRGQDWDLWLWLAWRHSVAYIPEVLGTYRVHGGNISAARDKMRTEDRDIIRKWRGKVSAGVYAKAMAYRYTFDLLAVLPPVVRRTLKKVSPWPR